ncbi:MAG: sigma-54-dependent Fis family transcriptional regulator [Gemmatimonadetes bacterium]|nr:sigma-54-dependent Fis family transcriptional regulator [Gemmatimonadota bacterium]
MSRNQAGPTDAKTNRELVEFYEWLRQVYREIESAPRQHPVDFLRAAAETRLGRRVSRRIRRGAPKIGGLDDLQAWAVGFLSDVANRVSDNGDHFDPDTTFAGYHPTIVRIRDSIDHLAASPDPVLLIGERGTGKGQLMRAIHCKLNGDSAKANAIHLMSLAATAETIAESELFGHERGSFTGATRTRSGALGHAIQSGEPLFLDDIGNCPESIQVKLLSALDDGIVRPVGADTPVSIGRGGACKLKIFAAIQPEALGKMRPDLRDRLWLSPTELPPLRKRDLDVLLLADLALEVACRGNTFRPRMTRNVRRQLLAERWPGNVRELISVVKRASRECGGATMLGTAALARVRQFDDRFRRRASRQRNDRTEPVDGSDHFLTLEEATDRHVREALERSSGNVSRAARLLGIPRSTLQGRLGRMRR